MPSLSAFTYWHNLSKPVTQESQTLRAIRSYQWSVFTFNNQMSFIRTVLSQYIFLLFSSYPSHSRAIYSVVPRIIVKNNKIRSSRKNRLIWYKSMFSIYGSILFVLKWWQYAVMWLTFVVFYYVSKWDRREEIVAEENVYRI